MHFRSKLKNELFTIPTVYLFARNSRALSWDFEVRDWMKEYNDHCAPGFPEAYYKTEYYKKVARENGEQNREIEQLRRKLQLLDERILVFEKSNNYKLMQGYELELKNLSNYKESINNLIIFRFHVVGQIIRRDAYTNMIFGAAMPIEDPVVFTDCATTTGQTKLTVTKWKPNSIEGSGLIFNEYGMYCVRPGIYSGEPPQPLDSRVKRYF